MVLLYKTSEFRSNLKMSVSSVIKDGKYCKANVTHIKTNSRNISNHMSMLQLYLARGKVRELKARDSKFHKMVWVKLFFHCLVLCLIFNYQGIGFREPQSSRDIGPGKGMPRRTQHYSNIPSSTSFLSGPPMEPGTFILIQDSI